VLSFKEYIGCHAWVLDGGQRLLFFVVFISFLVSCHSDDLPVEEEVSQRLVFVYMLADNNLDYFAVQDLNEMESAFPENTNDKLVVYVDRGRNGRPSHPYLMEIVHDNSDAIVSPILSSYPEQNSADAQTFHTILNEVFDYYRDETFSSKNIVFWSHGNAWLPQGISILTNRDKLLEEDTTKSFGLDNVPEESNMDIKELVQVLGNYHFDFLLFDACFMSSIEVLYELKNTTGYVIAAPTEVLSNGFPYQNVVPLFFEENLNVKKIAENYFEYYNNKLGLLKSASIAVIKMDEIESLTQRIYRFSTSLSSLSGRNIQKENILQLDRFDGKWIYDLRDFLQKTSEEHNLRTEYENITAQWEKVVVYENNTPFMVENIDLENCHGVSTYIPDNIHEKEVNEYYKTLSWFKASGYDKIFSDH